MQITYLIAVKSARAVTELVNEGIIDRWEICTAAQPVWNIVILVTYDENIAIVVDELTKPPNITGKDRVVMTEPTMCQIFLLQ